VVPWFREESHAEAAEGAEGAEEEAEKRGVIGVETRTLLFTGFLCVTCVSV